MKNEGIKEKVEERRTELIELTKEISEKNAKRRFEQIDESKGRKVKEVEEDGFFVDEEVESEDYEKREVDKKGNVL